MRSHTAGTVLRFSAPRQAIAARGRLVCTPPVFPHPQLPTAELDRPHPTGSRSPSLLNASSR